MKGENTKARNRREEMFRWSIYEIRPDGSTRRCTEDARIALSAIGARWDGGWIFLSEKPARLAIAWLAIVYYIQDYQYREISELKEVYENAFNNREFYAWNNQFGKCKYCIRPIFLYDEGYDYIIDPSTITFPTYEEGLKHAHKEVY